MTPATLTLELHHNSRTVAGLLERENHFTADHGFTVVPGAFPGKDRIEVTLEGLDFGRFDTEGDNYLCEFLDILPGDLISWHIPDGLGA